MQLGLVTVNEQARGIQIGLVNVSRGSVDGIQIGLINVADEADASIGLIPVTKRGGVAFDGWTSDTQLIHAGLKLRARKTYTLLSAGIQPIGVNLRSWSAGLGFGGPLVTRKHFSLELDNLLSVVNPGLAITRAPMIHDALRLIAAYRPFQHFAVLVGVTGNLLIDPVSTSDGSFRPSYIGAWQAVRPGPGTPGIQLWPGFLAGFEF
jgi:hypothetical protein